MAQEISHRRSTRIVDKGQLRFTVAERRHAARVVELIGPIIPVLADALQPRTEVLLHDLTKMPNTIAAISHSITGRDIGGPPTDLGVQAFGSGESKDRIRYRTEKANGHVMRSSSIYFRAPSGKGVACLCINTDVDELERARKTLELLAGWGGDTEAPQPAGGKPLETFPVSVETLTEGILNDAINAVGIPVDLMKKSHKLTVVRELQQRGFFTIREAVEVASRELDVSRYTVYKYLNELEAEVERP